MVSAAVCQHNSSQAVGTLAYDVLGSWDRVSYCQPGLNLRNLYLAQPSIFGDLQAQNSPFHSPSSPPKPGLAGSVPQLVTCEFGRVSCPVALSPVHLVPATLVGSAQTSLPCESDSDSLGPRAGGALAAAGPGQLLYTASPSLLSSLPCHLAVPWGQRLRPTHGVATGAWHRIVQVCPGNEWIGNDCSTSPPGCTGTRVSSGTCGGWPAGTCEVAVSLVLPHPPWCFFSLSPLLASPHLLMPGGSPQPLFCVLSPR